MSWVGGEGDGDSCHVNKSRIFIHPLLYTVHGSSSSVVFIHVLCHQNCFRFSQFLAFY